MQLEAAIAEFSFAHDYTPKTRTFYAQKLGHFRAWCAEQGIEDIGQVNAPLVRRYLTFVRETPTARYGVPPKSLTLVGYARAVKAFLHWCEREDLLPSGICARVEMPKAVQEVIGVFTPQQVELLLTACHDPHSARQTARDTALVCLLFDCGLRASEVVTLTVDNVHFTASDCWVKVMGKGRREREASLGRRARLALHKYILRYRGESRHPYVFLRRDGKPLAYEGIYRTVRRLQGKAGAEHFAGVRVSPHTMRHSFARFALEQTHDVYRVSTLLGHQNIATTTRYLRSYTSKEARRGLSVLDSLRD